METILSQNTQRQDEIIKTAFELIANKGVQKLTIKNLAAEIGISEPAIYRHFSSKREILEQIVEGFINMRNETWREALVLGKTAKESIFYFFELQAKKIEAFPSFSIALFPEEVFRNDEELLKQVQELIETTIENIKNIINRGIKNKEISKNVHEETICFMLIGGFRMLVSAWKRDEKDKNSLVKRVDSFVKNALGMF